MSHTYVNSLFHVVFSTKKRKNLITRDMEPRLWAYIGGIARENKMKALAVGGVEDHVHVLLSIPATISVSRAMRLIKGGSSRWIHESFPDQQGFAWQEGYGAFSIGPNGIKPTIAYIESQRELHQRRTFEQEFVLFLQKNGIEYDERYYPG
ncbi:MAG: IS200/IS605 family transposase [Phycisphaerales bacterium]|nr:IS200/IS605 family transposase [Phycisphaerales bacterium]MCB9856860.1 IS200/IS605 family transposase [Phycisphaerales bacterium]MCB9862013.1 IS200/IS605 family transposase [Phycisphaerales bacterium]